jgi:FKBP-type peptidyl-prolyl cis-trans isomerase
VPRRTLEGVSFQPHDVPIGPVAFRLGQGVLIDGLEAALLGQNAGTKFRALIPPEHGYLDTSMEPQPPTFAAKRQIVNHSKEPLLFEIQLLKVT